MSALVFKCDGLSENKGPIFLSPHFFCEYPLLVNPGDKGTNPVTALTVTCAAIHYPAVYNLQHHQRPVPLIRFLCGVRG